MKKLENLFEKALFKSRWLLAPFYLGLVLSIILLLDAPVFNSKNTCI